MTEIWPNFAPAFSCKAAACRHSCCRGWEIDVDDASFSFYSSLTDPFGKTIQNAVVTDGDGHHFRLDEKERCPFLLDSGLCDIILHLGEESLCDICTLHPRFFEDLGEYMLCGLGLSCEAVCELLLQSGEPLRFGGMRMEELLEMLGEPVPEEKLHFRPRKEEKYYEDLLSRFAETEAIDEQWTKELSRLSENVSAVRYYTERFDVGLYDRVFQYILYRQLECLQDCSIDRILAYAGDCTSFVFLTDAVTGNTPEALRRWSEQIEYSTVNVDLLMNQKTEF